MVLCSEVAMTDAEKESEARCKAMLNKLISEVKKQTLEMEDLAVCMNELAVGLKAVVQPLRAPVHALSPPVSTTPPRRCVTPESPTRCSMNYSDDDTASQTSAFLPDAAPGPPSTVALLDVAIPDPNVVNAKVLDSGLDSEAWLKASARPMRVQQKHALSQSVGKPMQEIDMANVYVGRVPSTVTADQLVELFRPFGQIVQARMFKFHGYSMVRYDSPSSAAAAIDYMDGYHIGGSTLGVRVARLPAESDAATNAPTLQMTGNEQGQIDMTNLYVCHPLYYVTTEKLIENFLPCGQITQAKVVDRYTGVSKGFGFVKFADPYSAAVAITHMNGYPLEGHMLDGYIQRLDISPPDRGKHRTGHIELTRSVAGADVNRKLFLGYATTAAAHALVTASSRGFDDAVVIFLQNGVDVDCMARVLLRSVKPALHANVDCTPLVAAITSRHISTVEHLIKEGSYLDCLVQVGSWSGDPASGEELCVGACLGEHYNATWCAVEYYESSGEILKLLLDKAPWLLENPNKGRNLLCHAILCQNPNAVSLLLQTGANPRFPIMTKSRHVSHLIHLATRLGYAPVLKQLMADGAEINAQTSTGDTPLMVSAWAGHSDCFLELIKFGADLGIVNNADITVFSPLHFFAGSGRAEPLLMMLHYSAEDLNKLYGSGLTPLMVAAESGHVDIFRLLVMTGDGKKQGTGCNGYTILVITVGGGLALLEVPLMLGFWTYWLVKKRRLAKQKQRFTLHYIRSTIYFTIHRIDEEIYMSFGLPSVSSSVLMKIDYSGKVKLLIRNSKMSEWTALQSEPNQECDTYGYCGPLGYCDNTEPITTCMCLDAVTYGVIVNCLCRFGKLDEAVACFRNCVEKGVAVNAIFYASLIDGFGKAGMVDGLAKAGRMDGACALYKRMDDDGCDRTVYTYTILIDGVQVRRGMEVLQIPWDPGGNGSYSFISAWGQAAFQGGRNVMDRPSFGLCLWAGSPGG